MTHKECNVAAAVSQCCLLVLVLFDCGELVNEHFALTARYAGATITSSEKEGRSTWEQRK